MTLPGHLRLSYRTVHHHLRGIVVVLPGDGIRWVFVLFVTCFYLSQLNWCHHSHHPSHLFSPSNPNDTIKTAARKWPINAANFGIHSMNAIKWSINAANFGIHSTDAIGMTANKVSQILAILFHSLIDATIHLSSLFPLKPQQHYQTHGNKMVHQCCQLWLSTLFNKRKNLK